MSSVVEINKYELQVKLFNGEPVVTLKEVDALHGKNGSAKRNFNYHMDRFIEGVDYHLMSIKDFRLNYNPAFTGKTGNPNILVVLLTESGYLLLTKTFSDDVAWGIQRALVQNYFRINKQSQMSQFDFMRHVVDVLESQQQAINLLEEKNEKIEQKLEQSIQLALPLEKEYFSSFYTARKLGLYSASGNNPHVSLLKSLAYDAGLNVNVKQNYEDEYIRVTVAANEVTRGTPIYSVEYTQKGINVIERHFKENKDKMYFEERRQKSTKYGKAGEIKKRGYKVGNTNFSIA